MVGRRGEDTWPTWRTAGLRRLWPEGHATAEIGRQLGVSKNAVVGKAHRLKLPPRPSPITRTLTPGHVKRRDLPESAGTAATLPVLALVAPEAVPVVRWPVRVRAVPMRHADAPARRACQRILEGSGRHSVFCGGACDGRRSYCVRCSEGLFVRAQPPRVLAHG